MTLSFSDAWLTSDPDALEALAALARDLADPPMTVDVAEAAELWSVEHYRFAAARPPGLQDYPELSLRLRGAFGRALAGVPPRRTATGRIRPHAFDVLFRPLARGHDGDEAPRPAIVRGEVGGDSLTVHLLVFGQAAAWAEQGAAAMARAMEAGIALASGTRMRVSAPPDAIERRSIGRIAVPAAPTCASLRVRSPVTARIGGRLNGDPRAILRGCVRRVLAMARWQGLRIAHDPPALARCIERLALDERELAAFRFARHSIRQGDTPIPMAGWLGTLGLDGPLAPLSPWLALAETCNTGSHAGLGMGWFDLAMA
jgi:hypothetical protein